MSISTTYTQARANFAEYCNKATHNHEIVVIHRRGAQDVALVSADELSSLMETAHLLRSPQNAKRLLTALNRAKKRTVKPKAVKLLKREMGIG
jgi:antitoxin YefM